MNETYVVRRVTGTSGEGNDATLALQAFPSIQVGQLPGHLTGEPLAEQGIETTLPNLPDLQLPPLDERRFAVRVSWAAADTVRLTIAPEGATVLSDDGTWLGIVVDPHPEAPPVTITETDDEVLVASSKIRVRVHRRPFAVHIEDLDSDRTVLRTSERLRQIAGFPMAPPVVVKDGRTTLHLELGTDEEILGFGEQFSRLVKNGQELVLRCEDAAGTGTGLAYKPVPVWQSSAGYTGFINTGAVVNADVGHSRPSVLGLTVDDGAIDLYVIVGESTAQRLTSYTAITGRPVVPPLWAFGYWLGRCRYSSSAQMLDVARTMRNQQIPLDILHCDPDWLVVDRLNCDFIWNHERFGERREFVQALDEQHVRLSLWELPYIDPASPRFEEAEQRGFLMRRGDGELAAITKTPTPDGRMRALIDFTNPDAVAWWQGMHEEFLRDGVAVFKTDFGEALPDDVAPHSGLPANHAHNMYPLYYNGAVWEAIAKVTERNALVWGRSGWAGSQRYPAQWAGDAESTVAGMQATVRGGLSYALSAPGFWSHDVGGFYGPDLTPELYVRWTQFGAFSPLMRAHGLHPREPWAFGEQALEIARRWIKLRYEFLPYLWQVAHESSENGWPMLRPLALEYPDDPVAPGLDGQFLLGSDLLVVPVFNDGAEPIERRFYVPEGSWTDILTGETVDGPCFVTWKVPLDRIPLLARRGAVLPRLTVDETVRRTDDLVDQPWTLHVYGNSDVDRVLVGFDGRVTRVAVRGDVASTDGPQLFSEKVVRDGG